MGISVHDFVDTLEQVAKIGEGGWKDVHMLGIGKCRVAAGAYDFFWRDE